MNSNYKIRNGRQSDVGKVVSIELAAAGLFSEEDLPAPIRFMASDLDILQAAISYERLWVACGDDDVPVGFAFADTIADSAYLEELDVHPQHMRQGIGSRLVSVVIDWARLRQSPQLRLVTFSHLPWNAPFYETLGFRILEPNEVEPEYQEVIDEDAEVGIDPQKRVVMELAL